MKKDESCCRPGSATNIEQTVKETYGQLWANQQKGKLSKRKWASMLQAHDVLVKELKLRKGMKVLDIGSGNGETVLTIAEKVGPTGKAVGVDFLSEGIALANQKVKERKLEGVAEFHLAKAQELPFPENSFDAVISECVVCLIQDKQKALSEKVRVLKPGGRVIMHDVVTWAPMPEFMKTDSNLYCACIGGAVTLDDYVDMMKKAGLTDIKTVDFIKDVRKTMNASVVSQVLNLKDDKVAHEIVDFVRKGGIGYALLVGTKPNKAHPLKAR